MHAHSLTQADYCNFLSARPIVQTAKLLITHYLPHCQEAEDCTNYNRRWTVAKNRRERKLKATAQNRSAGGRATQHWNEEQPKRKPKIQASDRSTKQHLHLWRHEPRQWRKWWWKEKVKAKLSKYKNSKKVKKRGKIENLLLLDRVNGITQILPPPLPTNR